jgi:hypothetical protein
VPTVVALATLVLVRLRAPDAPERISTHAQHDTAPDEHYTAVFEDFVPTPEVKQLLLDHILLSPGLSRADGLLRIPGSGAGPGVGSVGSRLRDSDSQRTISDDARTSFGAVVLIPVLDRSP